MGSSEGLPKLLIERGYWSLRGVETVTGTFWSEVYDSHTVRRGHGSGPDRRAAWEKAVQQALAYVQKESFSGVASLEEMVEAVEEWDAL